MILNLSHYHNAPAFGSAFTKSHKSPPKPRLWKSHQANPPARSLKQVRIEHLGDYGFAYLHENPIRAGMLRIEKDYVYSIGLDSHKNEKELIEIDFVWCKRIWGLFLIYQSVERYANTTDSLESPKASYLSLHHH